jgi:hypothetical protein
MADASRCIQNSRWSGEGGCLDEIKTARTIKSHGVLKMGGNEEDAKQALVTGCFFQLNLLEYRMQ